MLANEAVAPAAHFFHSIPIGWHILSNRKRKKRKKKTIILRNVSHYFEYLNVLTIRIREWCMPVAQGPRVEAPGAIATAFLHVFNQILLQSNQDIANSSATLVAKRAIPICSTQPKTRKQHQPGASQARPGSQAAKRTKTNQGKTQEYCANRQPCVESHSHNGIVTTVAYRLGTCRSPGSVVYIEMAMYLFFFFFFFLLPSMSSWLCR